MEESNSLDYMVMDEDTDESISLNDLRLMHAKLIEITERDDALEKELRKKLETLKKSSIKVIAAKLRGDLKEMKNMVEATKKENQLLSSCNFDDYMDNQRKILSDLLEPEKLASKEADRLSKESLVIKKLSDRLRTCSSCQTDLTFPPSFSSFSPDEGNFNAQDAFIELQLERRRHLTERLYFLKKQSRFEEPDVMLVKIDDYRKMLARSSIRRRKRTKCNQSQFDCFLELSDVLEKRPCLESPSPISLSSSTKEAGDAKMDEVVQLFFTAPPKQQANGQSSQSLTEDSPIDDQSNQNSSLSE